MNRLTTLLALTLCVSISACTKVFDEVASTDKRAPLARNILLFSSETPADIRIAYYATEDGVTNRLIEKEVQTPYILELEDAVATYDSMSFFSGYFCKHLNNTSRVYKQTREHEGPEYLQVENLSGQVVKVAAIDVQELKTEWYSHHGETVISDEHPLPLYRGVPLLYLLMPERAPGGEFNYVAVTEYERDGSGVGTSSTSVKQIPLFPDRLGEFTAEDLPFSVKRIVELYEREMEYLFIYYTQYSKVEQLGVSVDEVYNGFGKFLHNRKLEAVTHIAPHTTMRNPGTIPMLAMDLRLHVTDKKDYRKR